MAVSIAPATVGTVRRRARRIVIVATVIWLAISLIFWAWFLATQQFIAQFLYPYFWLILVGLPVWFNRRGLERLLARWRFPAFLKYLLLGYAMVLLEEVFAALVNNLTEGFGVALFLRRVGQFWAFNLLAFTGLIIGWYLLRRFVGYSRIEMFYLAGCFGLYAERTIYVLPSNPLAFALFAPLIIFTYGLILTPAALSLPEQPAGRRRRWYRIWLIRYPLALALPFIVALPFVGLLVALRTHYPDAFPPRRFIP